MAAPRLYPHIACCIDDSPASRAALAEAARLRALGPGRLSVVHVAAVPLSPRLGRRRPPAEDHATHARRWLGERIAESGVAGAEPVLLTPIGHPPSAVCDWAAEEDADLVVVASHRGLVSRVLVGSFTTYLAHHCPTTLLIVRAAAPSGDQG
jgi:nucleotide-binding universal stress UspA family protein